MLSHRKFVLVAAPVFLLSACGPQPKALAPSFGDAVRHNMAVHIINPDPVAEVEPAEFDGRRAALRYDQYTKGKETPIERPSTSSIKIINNK